MTTLYRRSPGTGFAASFKLPDSAERWWGKLNQSVTIEPEPVAFKIRAYLAHIGYGLAYTVAGEGSPYETHKVPTAYGIVDRGDGPWEQGKTQRSRRPAILYMQSWRHNAHGRTWTMEVQGSDAMGRMAALALDISRRFHVEIRVKMVSTEPVSDYYVPPRTD